MKCEIKYIRKDLKDFAKEFSKGRKLLSLIIISICDIIFGELLKHLIFIENMVELKTVNLILLAMTLILIGLMYLIAKIKCNFKKKILNSKTHSP